MVTAVTGLACDLPLAVPVWTTEWSLDVVAESRATSDFLPAGLQVDPDGGFRFDSVGRTDEVRLESVCEACLCFSGPIPAIELTPFTFGLPLPGAFASAELETGRAEIALVNHVGFDLLRNERGQFGLARIELLDTRTNRVVRDAQSVGPFPPGDTLRFGFDLDGVSLHPGLVARVLASIPGTACDSIPITSESAIGAELRLPEGRAPGVTVRIDPGSLGLQPRVVQLPGFLRSRLRAGEARLVMDVSTESTVGIDAELEVSVAVEAEDLFAEGAALFAPVPIPSGTPTAPHEGVDPLVVDLARLGDADALVVATRVRIPGDRQVDLTGLEALEYRVRLRLELPSS